MAKQSKPKAPLIVIGDFVLLGGTRASYPGGWYLGRVLWVGADDLLVEHSTQNGKTWRQVQHISSVRAIGTIAELNSIQDAARKAVHEFRQQVTDCEQALGAARAALFAKIDVLAEGGLKVLPPDFDAIEANHIQIRQAVEEYDNEGAALEQTGAA